MSTNIVKMEISQALLEFLTNGNYTIDDLFISYCIVIDKTDFLKSYLKNKTDSQKVAIFLRLERKGLIVKLSELQDFDLDNYAITELGDTLVDEAIFNIAHIEVQIENVSLSDSLPPETTQQFVDKFLDLWPKGVKNKAGDYLLSHRNDVKVKLGLFFKKYKYEEDAVLKATEAYLKIQKHQNFDFCNAAHYFISKNGVSKLAAECENYLNGGSEESFGNFSDRLM